MQEQLNRVESDLKELATKAGASSRRDWYLMFLGMFLAWVLGSVLPPEATKLYFGQLWGMLAIGRLAP